MVRLFIIADDFTGALDTGVKLAGLGAKTRVVTSFPEDPGICDADVLVWDSETRHLSPEQAREAIRSVAARLRTYPDCYFFKKTDSALRGNIGAELQGLLEGLNARQIAFLPAYPEINRTTENGVQYIDGVPVSESVFGRDLLNPVLHDSVAEIIAEQSSLPVRIRNTHEARLAEEGITVFDTVTRSQMDAIFTALQDQGVRLYAGCAGAGACLPQLLAPGTVLFTATQRDAEKVEIIRSLKLKNLPADTETPVVLLVNSFTASSGEIFTGALVDNKRAKTVGMRTFGKGTLLSVVRLANGGALRFASGRYRTPSGKVIEGRGIQPDHVVVTPLQTLHKLTLQMRRYPGEVRPNAKDAVADIQLEKALSLLVPPAEKPHDVTEKH